MGTKTHNNYEDLITFTRASAGHALRPVSYGAELVTNTTPNFDLSPSVGSFDTGVDAVAGKIYMIDVSATVTVSSVSLRINNSTSNWSEVVNLTIANGDRRIALQALTSGDIQINRNDASATANIATLSIKEVTFDESDGTLTLFEHPDNIPRVEYDADGNRLGLLVEEARTNRVQYSTPDSNWNTSTLGTGVTPVVTLNNETSPDGTTSAAKVVLDVSGGTTSGDRSLFLVPTANVTATNSYAGSVWLKGETGGERVVMRHAGNATYSLFTLTTSWARYDVTETAASSLATMAIGLKGNQSDATATIYVWGAQIEEGSFPTSTIVNNSGSTATRSADVASVPVADFGFNANAMTLLVEANNTDNCQVLTLIDDDSSANRIRLYESGSNVVGLATSEGTNVAVMVTSQSVVNDGLKAVIAAKKDDFVTVANAGSAITDSAGNMPVGLTDLNIATPESGGATGSVHIKSIKYYPRRLTDAQLQEITS